MTWAKGSFNCVACGTKITAKFPSDTIDLMCPVCGELLEENNCVRPSDYDDDIYRDDVGEPIEDDC